MQLIIFSKNRPMQLEAAIRSVYKNSGRTFSKIRVQYTSDPEYSLGYARVKNLYPAVDFYDEKWNGFKVVFKTLYLMDGRTCLMVDDNILFEKITADEIYQNWRKGEIFSLRLGDNIKNKIHHTYTGSLDGNIFELEQISPVFDKEFFNPNQLETALLSVTKHLKMSRFKESKLIGIPANRVSETSGCDYMEENTQELNRLFLRGMRIKFEKMDFTCDNVHKYMDYVIK